MFGLLSSTITLTLFTSSLTAAPSNRDYGYGGYGYGSGEQQQYPPAQRGGSQPYRGNSGNSWGGYDSGYSGSNSGYGYGSHSSAPIHKPKPKPKPKSHKPKHHTSNHNPNGGVGIQSVQPQYTTTSTPAIIPDSIAATAWVTSPNDRLIANGVAAFVPKNGVIHQYTFVGGPSYDPSATKNSTLSNQFTTSSGSSGTVTVPDGAPIAATNSLDLGGTLKTLDVIVALDSSSGNASPGLYLFSQTYTTLFMGHGPAISKSFPGMIADPSAFDGARVGISTTMFQPLTQTVNSIAAATWKNGNVPTLSVAYQTADNKVLLTELNRNTGAWTGPTEIAALSSPQKISLVIDSDSARYLWTSSGSQYNAIGASWTATCAAKTAAAKIQNTIGKFGVFWNPLRPNPAATVPSGVCDWAQVANLVPTGTTANYPIAVTQVPNNDQHLFWAQQGTLKEGVWNSNGYTGGMTQSSVTPSDPSAPIAATTHTLSGTPYVYVFHQAQDQGLAFSRAYGAGNWKFDTEVVSPIVTTTQVYGQSNY